MTSRSSRRLLAPVAVTTALLWAGAPAALAQTSTSPGGPSLSQAPPVSLGSGKKTHKSSSSKTAKKKNSSSSTARATRLPNTGYDVWAVALLGAGLIAAGVGLRLRVRDVRWP